MKWCILMGLLMVGICFGAEDSSIAETRFDPYLNGPQLVPIVGRPLGGPPYGEVPIYETGHFNEPFIHKGFYGLPYLESGYNGGFIRTGINEGGLALGNHGEQIIKQRNNGGFTDGSYHQGGGFIQDGYQELQGYKDNKHHVADDHSNKIYYSGVKGGRKDLGNGHVYDKAEEFSQKGSNLLGDNELKGYQKGHRRTGFRKSYHKDESGNDESYYDSDHDEGNREFGKKYGDHFDSSHSTGSKGGHNLNEYSAEEEGKDGYQGNGKLIHLNHGLKDYYGNSNRYNNGKYFGQQGGDQTSQLGKFGFQHRYQNGFNDGQNYESGKYGYLGPY